MKSEPAPTTRAPARRPATAFALALAALATAGPQLPAQDAPAGRRIELSLCCLVYADDQRVLFLKEQPAGEPAEVPLYQNGFPPAAPALVEDGKIVIYQKSPDAPGGWAPDWSFPAPPPPAASHFVILLPNPPDPAASQPAPYRAFPLPPAREFAYGSVMVLNLTGLNAGLQIGQRKVGVPPGRHAFVPLKPEADAFNQVDIAASLQAADGWVEFHTTKWTYNERIRQVAVVWMPPGRTTPEITSIREVKPAPSPAAPRSR